MSTTLNMQRFAIALAGVLCLAFAADVAAAGRGGGHGGGGARTSVNKPSGGGGGNQSANTNRNVNNNTNVNRNTNINQTTNVNVDRHVDVDVDRGWDDRYHHPVAAGMAIGATVAVTAAVVGSMVTTIPPSCAPVAMNGVTYQQCGSTWYQPQYAGTSVQYVVVNPPG